MEKVELGLPENGTQNARAILRALRRGPYSGCSGLRRLALDATDKASFDPNKLSAIESLASERAGAI